MTTTIMMTRAENQIHQSGVLPTEFRDGLSSPVGSIRALLIHLRLSSGPCRIY
jgi:hypothetical protein